MKYYITGLEAPEAMQISRFLWELLKPAVDRAPEAIRYTYQQLIEEIVLRKTQVWAVVDLEKDDIIGAFTTAISEDTQLPGVTLLEIPLVAGKDIKGWLGTGLKILNAWGTAHGADIMVAYGRKGWERLAGFTFYSESADGVRIMVRPIGGFH